MKNFYQTILIGIISLIFLTNLNAQPASNPSTESPRGDRRRPSPVGVETKVESSVIRDNQPQTIELRCRGINAGGTQTFKTVGSRTDTTGAVILTIELSFSPSMDAAGANSSGLLPGECSFIDRPLSGLHRTGEPWRVRFETPANAQLKQTQSGSQVDRSPTAAEKFPDANSIPRYLESPSYFWSFRVINTGKGYFEAQSHQPWKKMLQDKMLPKKDILVRPF